MRILQNFFNFFFPQPLEIKKPKGRKLAARMLARSFSWAWGMPDLPTSIALITEAADLENLPDFLAQYPHCRLDVIALSDFSEHPNSTLRLPTQLAETRSIPVIPLSHLNKHPDLTAVLYSATKNPALPANFPEALESLGNFYVAAPAVTAPQLRAYPHFYTCWKSQLEKLAAQLTGENSRETLAAYVKALCAGNPAYLAPSGYSIYRHTRLPDRQTGALVYAEAKPEIGPSLLHQLASGYRQAFFCAPDAADRYIPPQPPHSMTPLSVHLARPETEISALLDKRISSFSTAITTIDALVADQRIAKPSTIILNLGDAASTALRGAMNTLLAHKPNLIISLPGDPEAVIEIPEFIQSLNLGYAFYLGQHGLTDSGFTLYAIYKKNKKK